MVQKRREHWDQARRTLKDALAARRERLPAVSWPIVVRWSSWPRSSGTRGAEVAHRYYAQARELEAALLTEEVDEA